VITLAFANDIALNIMFVCVVVCVHRQAVGYTRAKKGQVGGISAHRFGLAVTTHMTV
jgi:hypothetical protein